MFKFLNSLLYNSFFDETKKATGEEEIVFRYLNAIAEKLKPFYADSLIVGRGSMYTSVAEPEQENPSIQLGSRSSYIEARIKCMTMPVIFEVDQVDLLKGELCIKTKIPDKEIKLIEDLIEKCRAELKIYCSKNPSYLNMPIRKL